MSGLLSLPSELLQSIGDDLGPAKKQLRLVCSQLSVVLRPLVLSHVVINVTRPRLPTVNTQLQLLASKEHHTASFIRELSIRSLSPSRDSRPGCAQMMFSGGSWNAAVRKRDNIDALLKTSDGCGEEEIMMRYLEDAISGMENLQVVRWNTSADDPSWASLAVIRGLACSKTLTYLNLYLGFGFDASILRFDLLHGLKRIVISGTCESFPADVVKRLGDCIAQSSEMNSVDIDRSMCRGDIDIPSLHCLLGNAPLLHLKHLGLHSWYTRFDNITLPHLRFLKSLTLLNNLDPSPRDGHSFSSTATDLWFALRVNKIHLERISTDAIDLSLIEYLASYSGLTRLYLRNIVSPDHQSSDQLAEIFFDSALTAHTGTLEDLYITPRYEGKWCFGDHVAPSLARCSRLQYLRVAAISSEVNPSNDNTRGDSIINTLINTAARHLHALKSLCITTAQAESLRGFRHAVASKKHFSFANEAIAKAIVGYVPEPMYQAYLPIVTANLIKYKPELVMDGTDMCMRYLL